MTHAHASILISDDSTLVAEVATLTFIDDVEYEFVGGGATATNGD